MLSFLVMSLSHRPDLKDFELGIKSSSLGRFVVFLESNLHQSRIKNELGQKFQHAQTPSPISKIVP